MGEIAEMFLDGTLDCETGEYIGEPCGYPRTGERPHRLPRHKGARPAATQPAKIRKKDRAWLTEIARDLGGMYPGIQQVFVPDGPANRLRRAGLIESYTPHNLSHLSRWVISASGAALIASEGT